MGVVMAVEMMGVVMAAEMTGAAVAAQTSGVAGTRCTGNPRGKATETTRRTVQHPQSRQPKTLLIRVQFLFTHHVQILHQVSRC